MSARIALQIAILAFPFAPALADTVAITGARIHTMAALGTLENATVVMQDGRIVAVGADVVVPDGATLIDAGGKIITPGILSPFGQLGLVEVDAVAGTVDAVQRGTQYSASFDVAEAYNPRSTLLAVNRSEGITGALIAPMPSDPDEFGNVSSVFSGLASFVSLQPGPGFLVRRGAAMLVNLGESGGDLAGGSRAAALQMLRSAIADARDYRENRAAWARGERRAYSLSGADLEALQAVLDGTVALMVRVNRASDISVLLDLAEEYSVRLILLGAAEAWMLAKELAAADVPVILDTTNNLPGSFDQLNARLDAAAILSAAGVRLTFGGESSSQTHNARNITQAAGIAVANGMNRDSALRAITRTPADIFGIEEDFGSLETGKAADLIVWPADPLELTSFPESVFIAGAPVSLQNRQTLLRDRYLDPDTDKPPAFRR
jgi:imidazolonepropionase-like amidohydrolase